MSIECFKNKKGSLFVETSIILPFFLLAILSIAILIKAIGVEESTMGCFAEEGQRCAKEMYLTQIDESFESYETELFQDVIFKHRTLKRLKDHELVELKNINIERFGFRQDPGIVNYRLSYEIDVPLPLSFRRGLKFEQTLLFRGFIGAENADGGLGFDEMERPDSLSSVYVFPRAGEKYHRFDCRVIDVYPVERILSPEIKRVYRPCKLCNASCLPWGCRVYCFEKNGKVYHRGSCTTVDRYVVEMDKEEAVEKGYTPCLFCGGGDD